ncbi:hypothetical protein CYCD_02730 [Tenuifilaceae bacterium CYCD]|nr:hypothetical protein CYCD_02730 [Tenuifilaceae bacterium CYCD]
MKIDVGTKKLLERLTSKVNEAMQAHTAYVNDCSTQDTPLPYYSNFKLYTLFDTSYTPVVQYNLLDNGTDTIYLDGTLNAWKKANEIEKPELTISNVMDYAKMVVSSISKENIKHNIVTSIEDIDFYQMPTVEQFQLIESSIKPPVISFRNNSFNILACLIEGKELYDSLISVKSTGEIEISDKNLILQDIPVDEFAWD